MWLKIGESLININTVSMVDSVQDRPNDIRLVIGTTESFIKLTDEEAKKAVIAKITETLSKKDIILELT